MNYETLKQQTASGWNTWNTANVLSHVLLPYGFCINLCIKEYSTERVLREALIGRFDEKDEHIHPGPRSYDGSYTTLDITYMSLSLTIESAVENGELYILLTPKSYGKRVPTLIVEGCLLWNKPGLVGRRSDYLEAIFDDRTVQVFVSTPLIEIKHTYSLTPYLSVDLDQPVLVSTKKDVSIADARRIINANKKRLDDEAMKYGPLSETYTAMRSCLGWDTIYEPEHDRICTPVSRIWNIVWGGYVLFCWDTYFASMMANFDNKELAYLNALAITHERTEAGFIPNFGAAHDYKSRDRSQPPVGSLACLAIYKRWRELWFLEEVFEALYTWNSWFYEHRRMNENLLCWGSDPFEPVSGKYWENENTHCLFGAALESGLDNSPMYDDAGYDEHSCLMQLADVGLCGLYIMDCEALAEIAGILGRITERDTLLQRAETVKVALSGLWCEEKGIFLNKDTVTGAFSDRISPTNFYALLSDSVTSEQATRMMNEHFYNPEEFWGDFIIPSIARNDPAYPDQSYWRGRIWAPMNFLVYLSLRKQGLHKECADLAQRSNALLLKEWTAHGHVHENYSGDDGWGCGVGNSDKFYHWGALLSLIALMDGGYIE